MGLLLNTVFSHGKRIFDRRISIVIYFLMLLITMMFLGNISAIIMTSIRHFPNFNAFSKNLQNVTVNQSMDIVIPDAIFEGDLAQIKSRVQEFLISKLSHKSDTQTNQTQLFNHNQSDAVPTNFKKEALVNKNFTTPQRWIDTRVKGFKYCSILDNAEFNPWIHIDPLGGSLLKINPPVELFIELIDFAAERLFQRLNNLTTSKVDETNGKRFSCYMTVFGESNYTSVSKDALLQSIDASHYFPFLSLQGSDPAEKYIVRPYASIPKEKWMNDSSNGTRFMEKATEGPLKIELKHSLVANQSQNVTTSRLAKSGKERRHFKIAYLLLVHENFDTVVRTIQAIYSKQGIYLIHIDKNSEHLRVDLEKWIDHNRKVIGDADNIHIIAKPFALQWGSTSIVMAQLEGFYQLLDLAEWDYVINLSAFDYPLYSTNAIHKILEETPGKSYIGYWESDWEVNERLRWTLFISANQKEMVWGNPKREPPSWIKEYPILKHHQWMILSQSLVRQIRRSQEAYDLLAFMEHMALTDEVFFAMLAKKPSFGYSETIVADAKRFISFPQSGSRHPLSLKNGDQNIITQHNNQYFFVRKVDSHSESQLAQWMDDQRASTDTQLGIAKSEEPLPSKGSPTNNGRDVIASASVTPFDDK